MENKKQIELAKKLQALAQRGVGGEAENAQKMLEKLLTKYNISLEEMGQESMEYYYFKADTQSFRFRILVQIIFSIRYDMECHHISSIQKARSYGWAGNVKVLCTLAEYIQIDQMFDIYTKLWLKELDVFFNAFVVANKITISNPNKKLTIDDLSPEEAKKWRRACNMSDNVKKATINKQLPNKDTEDAYDSARRGFRENY